MFDLHKINCNVSSYYIILLKCFNYRRQAKVCFCICWFVCWQNNSKSDEITVEGWDVRLAIND